MSVSLAFRFVACLVALLGATAATAQVDVAELVRQYQAAQQAKAQGQDSGRVMVLVSLAMPEESLIRLAKDARVAGAQLILRGLVNNSVKKTSGAIIKLDPSGATQWQVDPRPFRQIEAQGVPVFWVEAKDDRQLIRGDVSLAYALEQIAKGSGAAASLAAARHKNMHKEKGQ